MTKFPKNVDMFLERGCGRCSKANTPDCKVNSWTSVVKTLRGWILDAGFQETIKWGQPCYMAEGKNQLILAVFQQSCAISFFHGAQLSDPDNVLEKPGDHSQNGRFLRFHSATGLGYLESTARDLLRQTMDNAKQGIRPKKKPAPKIDLPQELSDAFTQDPDLETAFYALTPGRQRGYLIHFTSAKQPATRASRIEKAHDSILSGRGLHDRD